jgi:uncharacterized small protein (DUF1192 family)
VSKLVEELRECADWQAMRGAGGTTMRVLGQAADHIERMEAELARVRKDAHKLWVEATNSEYVVNEDGEVCGYLARQEWLEQLEALAPQPAPVEQQEIARLEAELEKNRTKIGAKHNEKAVAVLPNGAVASNVYEAYAEGLKSITNNTPVLYQYRTRPTWTDDKSWHEWENCTHETAAEYTRLPEDMGWLFEVRALCALKSSGFEPQEQK